MKTKQNKSTVLVLDGNHQGTIQKDYHLAVNYALELILVDTGTHSDLF